jgi:hypothetical protein
MEQREKKKTMDGMPVVVLVGIEGKAYQVSLSNDQGARVLEFIMRCFDNRGQLRVNETPYENIEIYYERDDNPEVLTNNPTE